MPSSIPWEPPPPVVASSPSSSASLLPLLDSEYSAASRRFFGDVVGVLAYAMLTAVWLTAVSLLAGASGNALALAFGILAPTPGWVYVVNRLGQSYRLRADALALLACAVDADSGARARHWLGLDRG